MQPACRQGRVGVSFAGSVSPVEQRGNTDTQLLDRCGIEKFVCEYQHSFAHSTLAGNGWDGYKSSSRTALCVRAYPDRPALASPANGKQFTVSAPTGHTVTVSFVLPTHLAPFLTVALPCRWSKIAVWGLAVQLGEQPGDEEVRGEGGRDTDRGRREHTVVQVQRAGAEHRADDLHVERVREDRQPVQPEHPVGNLCDVSSGRTESACGRQAERELRHWIDRDVQLDTRWMGHDLWTEWVQLHAVREGGQHGAEDCDWDQQDKRDSDGYHEDRDADVVRGGGGRAGQDSGIGEQDVQGVLLACQPADIAGDGAADEGQHRVRERVEGAGVAGVAAADSVGRDVLGDEERGGEGERNSGVDKQRDERGGGRGVHARGGDAERGTGTRRAQGTRAGT